MEDYAPFNQERFNAWLSDNGDSTKRMDYSLGEDSIVFDLGGYKGEWAAQILSRYKSNIFVFEPVTEFFDLISRNFNGNPKIKTYKFGLGANDENIEISLTKDSSSTFNTDGTKETIQLKKMSSFISENNIDKVDLMKINIEGGEYDLLDDLIANSLLEKFENIQVQFHRFIPNCIERRNKIREELAKTHELTYDYEFIWENWQLKK